MDKFTLLNINLLLYCLLKLSLVNSRSHGYDKRINSRFTTQTDEKYSDNLSRQLLANFGLDPNDLDGIEQYTKLSEQLPHFVPDFMRSLFEKYRFQMYNLSLEIEGRQKFLGSIEMIQSHRVKEIYTWPKTRIHKLIFKRNLQQESQLPFARELRLNKKLFPNSLFTPKKRLSNVMSLLTISNSHFQIVKYRILHDFSFTKDGWLSVDISNNTEDFTFYLKLFTVMKTDKGHFKTLPSKVYLPSTRDLYPYSANIISFYRNKSPSVAENLHRTPNGHSRQKRDISQYSPDHSGDCQRHPLIVTFKEVGWSKWIIAPQNYNAYYCKGNCPYPLSDNFNTTNHAIIQLLVHGLKDVSVPKPCCVPFQLTTETLLYLNNEGDALLREFKDMSVSSCSCR